MNDGSVIAEKDRHTHRQMDREDYGLKVKLESKTVFISVYCICMLVELQSFIQCNSIVQFSFDHWQN